MFTYDHKPTNDWSDKGNSLSYWSTTITLIRTRLIFNYTVVLFYINICNLNDFDLNRKISYNIVYLLNKKRCVTMAG